MTNTTSTSGNIVFMGTPDFAVPALRALHSAFGVAAVVTVPDKPSGRGLEVQPSAVKVVAQELGVSIILQPAKLRDPAFIEAMHAIKPDVICVIAFRILPEVVFSIARRGTFNVHASLLPRYRGAAPIHHAIINGDRQTGVTSFLLNTDVDTGSIIEQRAIEIPDGTTAGDLYNLLKPLAADCAVSTTRALIENTAKPTPQNHLIATTAPKVFRETAQIVWDMPVQRVRNFIHGHSPTPCAWTLWNGSTLKVYRAAYSTRECRPWEWFISESELIAGCSDGSLSLTEVQLPGKRRMKIADVLRGYRGPVNGSFAHIEQS